MNPKTVWRREELRYLRKCSKDDIGEVAKVLGRSEAGVRSKARQVDIYFKKRKQKKKQKETIKKWNPFYLVTGEEFDKNFVYMMDHTDNNNYRQRRLVGDVFIP